MFPQKDGWRTFAGENVISFLLQFSSVFDLLPQLPMYKPVTVTLFSSVIFCTSQCICLWYDCIFKRLILHGIHIYIENDHASSPLCRKLHMCLCFGIQSMLLYMFTWRKFSIRGLFCMWLPFVHRCWNIRSYITSPKASN